MGRRHLVAAEHPGSGGRKLARAVSGLCAGATSCEAVGSYTDSTFQQATLAEVWNGTAWAAQRPPNPPGSLGSALSAVSCAAASSCAAVGQYSVSVPTLALVEIWDGASWRLRSTPSLPFADFYGVSRGASGACAAVGTTSDLGGYTATLIEAGD